MPHRLRFVAATTGGAAAPPPARGVPFAVSAQALLGWAVKLLLVVAAFWLVSTGDAHAQACTPTITDTNFGSPNTVTDTGLTTTATISFSCTGLGGGTTYYVCPSFGQGSGGVSGTSRVMTGGGSSLLYNLYSNAARTVRWGSLTDTSLGTVPRITIARSGSTGTASATIYGGIATGQDSVQPGSYSSGFSGQVSVKLISGGGGANCTTNAALSTNNSGSFTVLASPVAACTVTAATLNFGSDGLLDANRDATSTLSVTCASGLAYSIQLDNGGTGTGPTARQMVNGGQDITYALYRDAARSLPWGGAGQAPSASGTGAAQAYTVYGRVPPQATPTPGVYSDTVVASVVY